MRDEQIRYARSADGVQIAWTEGGTGPRTLVCAANLLSDIKWDMESSARGAIERLERNFRVIRFDHRGQGSSQRNVERQGQDAWVEDLEAVIGAAGLHEPCVLFGGSHASPYTAAFAAKRPDLISHLILGGAYACGALVSPLPQLVAYAEAELELVRLNWDSPTPRARLMIISTFLPDLQAVDMEWCDRLPLTMNAADALRFFRASHEQDARGALPNIRTPTLVMATTDDVVILPEWTRIVAAAIPGAQYLKTPGRNHIPMPSDPGFELMFDHLHAFVATAPADDPLAGLSARERDILEGVRAGLSNEAIALQRNISTKTVRNHLTRVFDKLRVNSRTQAALVAARAN